MNARRTREQQRAASAWNQVEKIESGETRTKKKEYGSLARGLPAMLQGNGLGQTLAFLRAKGEGNSQKPQSVLYQHLEEWLNAKISNKPDEDFLKWLVHQNSDTYRRATTEALAYALWLRRFAEAQGWGEEQTGDEDASTE